MLSDHCALTAPATSLEAPLPPRPATKGICRAWPGDSRTLLLPSGLPLSQLVLAYGLLVVKYFKYPSPGGVSQKKHRGKSVDFWVSCDSQEPPFYVWWWQRESSRIIFLIKMLHMFFSFLFIYSIHSKVHKAEVYRSLKFYTCTPTYPPPRSIYRTFLASQLAPSCLLSINYPK